MILHTMCWISGRPGDCPLNKAAAGRDGGEEMEMEEGGTEREGIGEERSGVREVREG